MIMLNYLFPIFAFGIVITGIVFLGLQQASDLAKNLAAERSEAENRFKIPGTDLRGRNGSPVQVPTIKSRP